MSEKDFTKQREKWEHWLQERQNAGTQDEPLLVFVDDDVYQRDLRYYEMRPQKHPGRNILLFESTDEAIEFIRFATEKQLHLGAVVSDFDNGKDKNGVQIETYGSKVLEAAIEYGRKRNHPVVKLLISSTHRDISLDPKSKEYRHNKPLADFNITDEAKRQGAVLSFVKNDLDIERKLTDVPKPKTIQERQKLIPDLIFSMRMIDALLNKFYTEFLKYKDLVPPLNPAIVDHIFSSGASIKELDPEAVDNVFKKTKKLFKDQKLQKEMTIADIYAPAIDVIGEVDRSIEDMLKVWALVKDFEQKEIAKLGLKVHSPNPDADEPEDPLNVRILGNLFLDQFKRIQSDLGKYSSQLFVFEEVAMAIRANEKFGNADEREEIARKVTHNLKGPMMAIGNQVLHMAKAIEEYIENPPQTLMKEPEVGEYRFDHEKLKAMMLHYYLGKPRPTFAIVPANTVKDDQHATTDRTQNTPGKKAPTRETIICPNEKTKNEKEGDAIHKKPEPIKGIQKDFMRQLDRIVKIDQNNTASTSAGQSNRTLETLMGNLKKQLAAERQQGK